MSASVGMPLPITKLFKIGIVKILQVVFCYMCPGDLRRLIKIEFKNTCFQPLSEEKTAF